ncbi:MAG TPA: hypothetical protein VNQ90_02655 [Chthoniobacteraceae bacterium]|nr:hypothetical protein [Chthoniobacteraceae bacterium]
MNRPRQWFPLLPKIRKVSTFENLAELKTRPKYLKVTLHYTYYDPHGEEFPNIVTQKASIVVTPEANP